MCVLARHQTSGAVDLAGHPNQRDAVPESPTNLVTWLRCGLVRASSFGIHARGGKGTVPDAVRHTRGRLLPRLPQVSRVPTAGGTGLLPSASPATHAIRTCQRDRRESTGFDRLETSIEIEFLFYWDLFRK